MSGSHEVNARRLGHPARAPNVPMLCINSLKKTDRKVRQVSLRASLRGFGGWLEWGPRGDCGVHVTPRSRLQRHARTSARSDAIST